jgi:sirohydrochlorin ferrochelatase
MSRPTLVAVAHGSAHPQAATMVAALAGHVTRLAPVIDIRVAFVQHARPSLPEALDVAGKDAIVVPLLLSSGYHLTKDIASAVNLDQKVTGPLGPDRLLVTALVSRLAEAQVPEGTPVVLAAAGSADQEAARQVGSQATLLAQALNVPVRVAFAAAGLPAVPDAVADLRAQTGAQVAVAAYLLTRGHFHDQLANAGADWVTAPLGDHPAVAALVIDRYRGAA